MKPIVTAAVLFALVPLACAADPPAEDDAQDALLLADAGPVLLRLHVRIDGRPVSAAWQHYLDRLFADLDQHGLLDTTLVVWMGEFGRTPQVNGQAGRDHFPVAWTTVLAGGGSKGGQVVGKTGKDGTAVEDRPVPVPDFMATVCKALGIDYTKTYTARNGRPMPKVAKEAKPVTQLFAG